MGKIKNEYVKRTQEDYGIFFKLFVVSKIERKNILVSGAKCKCGIQGGIRQLIAYENTVALTGKIKHPATYQIVKIKRYCILSKKSSYWKLIENMLDSY